MAHSAHKVFLLLLLGMVREVVTQNMMPLDSEAMSYPSHSYQMARNRLSEDDAIQMGRTAAEDMGNIMASPPIKIFRGPAPQGTNSVSNAHGRSSETEPGYEQFYDQFTQNMGSPSDPRIVCFQYVTEPESHSQGRSAQQRSVGSKTIPLSPGLPGLGLPAIPSLMPILQALIPQNRGLLGPQRLLRVPPLPPVKKDPLLPSYLGRNLLTPALIARINPTLPFVGRTPLVTRSSFTPNSFKINLNPLVYYS